MKKSTFVFLTGLALLTATEVKAQFDADNYNMFAGMEVMPQWKFTPEREYYSTYKKKINMGFFSFKMNVPGEGWHDNGFWGWGFNRTPNIYAAAAGNFSAVFLPDHYVKEVWRKMTPLRLSAVAEVELQYSSVSQSTKDWNSIMKKDALTEADRYGLAESLGADWLSAYQITSGDRNKACYAISTIIYQLENDYDFDVDDLNDEYDSILQEVSTIHNAHMDNAKKLVALEACNKSLTKLLDGCNGVLALVKYNYEYGDLAKAGAGASLQEIMNMKKDDKEDKNDNPFLPIEKIPIVNEDDLLDYEDLTTSFSILE